MFVKYEVGLNYCRKLINRPQEYQNQQIEKYREDAANKL